MNDVKKAMVRYRFGWGDIAAKLRVNRSTLWRWRKQGFTPEQAEAVRDVVSELVQEVRDNA